MAGNRASPEPTPAEEYEAALRAYLADGSEEALRSADAIGTRLLAQGLGALAEAHGSTLKSVLAASTGSAYIECIVDRGTRFLVRATAPFELLDNGLENQFLAHLSHELRTPLNSILGFSDLLLSPKSSQLDERQQRYLTHINSAAKQLLTLVDEIADRLGGSRHPR